jgi:hypothetical protein
MASLIRRMLAMIIGQNGTFCYIFCHSVWMQNCKTFTCKEMDANTHGVGSVISV